MVGLPCLKRLRARRTSSAPNSLVYLTYVSFPVRSPSPQIRSPKPHAFRSQPHLFAHAIALASRRPSERTAMRQPPASDPQGRNKIASPPQLFRSFDFLGGRSEPYEIPD